MSKGSKSRIMDKDSYDRNYENIYGRQKPPNEKKELQNNTTFHEYDSKKSRDWAKIGKEVIRMSQLNEKHKHRELDGECQKLMEKKPDKELTKRITKEFIERLKQGG